MDVFHINDRVTIVGKNSVGTIAFIGNTHFSRGLWLGVILDQPVGRNNGSYEGIRYFKCGMNHGIFAHPSQVKKVSFIPSESKVRKVSSRTHYPNYLKDDSLSNPNKKQDSYAKKSTLLKKVRKDITLTSTSIPFFSSEGDVNLDGNNTEVKPKSMTKSEKYLPKTQFSQQEKEAKDSSSDNETRMYACELRDMALKTSRELNEVKYNVHSLDRETQTLKDYHEKQFSQQEKEAKDSSSDNDIRMYACELRDMTLKTSRELKEVKDNTHSLDRETQSSTGFREKQFPQQEKEAKDSFSDEEATGRACELRDMISKTSKELNEVKDYVLNLDRKLNLLKISLREESSSSVEN